MALINTLVPFFKCWDKDIKMKLLDIKESLLKKNFAKNKNSKCW